MGFAVHRGQTRRQLTGAVQVTLCRVVLACVCLSPVALARGGPVMLLKPLHSHWCAIILLGLLNIGASQLLALSALNSCQPQ